MHYARITSILCTRTALARRDGHTFVSGMKLKELLKTTTLARGAGAGRHIVLIQMICNQAQNTCD